MPHGHPIFWTQDNLPLLLILMAGFNKSTLDMECTLAKHTLNGKELDEIIKVLRELSPSLAAFPLLVKLIQIALTTAVHTAHCE